MKITRHILLSGFFCSSFAAAQDHSIGAKVGLLGLGLEYSYQVTDKLVVRGGINGSDVEFDDTESGIDYDFTLDFDSIMAGIDFHPFEGAFRLSGGFLKNDTSMLGIGSGSSGEFDIGDGTYDAADVSPLQGTIAFDGTAPYIGIGWDWLREKRIGLQFEMGIVDQGAPNVALEAFGPIAGDPGFQADLAAEEAELTDSVDDLDLWPYASFSISVRF